MNTHATHAAFLTAFVGAPQPDAERIANFGRKLRKLLSSYPYLEFRLANFSFVQQAANADGTCPLLTVSRRMQIEAIIAGLHACRATPYDLFLMRTLEQTELPSPAHSKGQPE